MILKKRLVRLHMKNGAPSVEGIQVGDRAGHYCLAAPRLLETEDRTVELDGTLDVPRENVLFRQVLS